MLVGNYRELSEFRTADGLQCTAGGHTPSPLEVPVVTVGAGDGSGDFKVVYSVYFFLSFFRAFIIAGVNI